MVPPPAGIADPADTPAAAAQLNADQAMAKAKRTGEPVVAGALTDEHTLITADPATGLMRAELTAGVARVPDGNGGWQEPSTTLTEGSDGTFHPAAAAADITISGGGSGSIAVVGDGDNTVSLNWPSPLPTPSIDGDLATYPEVSPGIDLVVKATVEGAETYLVVKNADAAQSPTAQQVPISVSASDLDAAKHADGAVIYTGDDASSQIAVRPAYIWDSTGQDDNATIQDVLEPAEGAQVASLPVTVSQASDTATFTTGTDAKSILDDPGTTYPVVIDPSAAVLDQSYAVRVTQEFNKYNDDIGDRGKIGYNGWTSPYYKSRMYYQFHWPTNTSGAPFVAAQIAGGKFQYTQTHSPQHSPCKSTSTSYPGEKVKLFNAIGSDTTWSNLPDSHDWSPVTTYLAVGHEDYCDTTEVQEWNITGMLQDERGVYGTRTTVTVGIYSADETDKMGWREYKNTSTSPKLVLDYEPEPPAPTAFTIDNPVSDPQGLLVTTRADVNLGVTATLASGYGCRGANSRCVQAVYTVTRGSTAIVTDQHSAGVLADATEKAQIGLTGLTSGAYQVSVRTYNSYTGLYTLTANVPTFKFTVDLTPKQPTWTWTKPAGWTSTTTLPASQNLTMHVTPDASDSGRTGLEACVTIDGAPFDLNAADTSDNCPVLPGDGNLTIPAGTFGMGQTPVVGVAIKNAHSTSSAALNQTIQFT
ncbi:MAG: hypothetical protein QM779_13885 [Propionicimonas sp.]|uniref:hypothetical protein n=1 Tax=Propionicimonas sp. TaxID=1955623 RepID=UPI003D0FA842